MAITSLNLVIDIENGTFLQAVGSRINANTIKLAQGDNIAVTATMVTQSDDFTTPTPITNFPAGCTVTVGVGIPGEPVCALALLNGPDSLEGPIRTGTLNLNTPEIDTLLGAETSVPAYIEVELIETDGTITTLAQVQCVVINDLLIGGTPPEPAEPPYPSSPALIAQLAHLEADKADKTTTITGTGNLTGGGDLSANRTLDMANMEEATIKGRASGAGTGTPTNLTGTQVAAILPDASATVRGVIPVGMIPVPGAFATDDQVMTGASPQAGRRGGVNRAASSTMTGALAAQSGDYTAGIEVHNLPSSLTDILVGSGSGATVTVRASKTQVQIDAAGGGASSVITLTSADHACFAIVRSGLRGLELFRNGVSVATLTSSSDTSTSLPMPTATTAYAHDVKDHWYFNRALTVAEIKLCNKVETPAELARQAGATKVAADATNTLPGFNPYDSFSNSGGNISVSQSVGVSGSCTFFTYTLKTGQKLRVEGTVSSNTLLVTELALHTIGGVGVATVLLPASGAYSVDLTAPADGVYAAGLRSPGVSTGSVALTTPTIRLLGTVEHFDADKVVHSGAWCGKFGTVLRPGSGVTPLDPVPSVTRVISGTVAGATVTAGTIASIGTFTPTAGYDATAYAAIGQWDAVSGTWGQARPTNATGVITTATAAGTVTVETAALTSNATMSASTPVKLTHHIV